MKIGLRVTCLIFILIHLIGAAIEVCLYFIQQGEADDTKRRLRP